MRNIFYCVFALMLFVPTAFAQTESLITVQTDDNTYDQGDSVIISGNVSTVIEKTPVILRVLHEGTIIEVRQRDVAQDGTYSAIINANGPKWTREGEYIVVATYGEDSSETKFNYFPEVDSLATTNIFEVGAGSSGTFDVKYTIKGGIVTDMRIDEKNLALIVTIDTDDEGTISLDMPRSAIDAKTMDQADIKFIINIDESEILHEEFTADPDSRIITVDFEEGDSEIMIIGTWVIPEFGTMAMIVFATMITILVFLTRGKMSVRI